MKHIKYSLLLLVLTTTLGCSGMSNTQQKTLSGAVLGTITGYILGESDK